MDRNPLPKPASTTEVLLVAVIDRLDALIDVVRRQGAAAAEPPQRRTRIAPKKDAARGGPDG